MTRFLTILFAFVVSTQAATWYVSTTGTDGAPGTLASPLSMHGALGDVALTSPVGPGDTVYIRAGNYHPGHHVDGDNYFRADFAGTSGARITVMPYQGEHVAFESTITNATPLVINGAYTTWRDFEIFCSAPQRIVTSQRGPGFQNQAIGTKFINCVFHDTGDGIYSGTAGTGVEIYGCLFYNWGYDMSPPDRGHGHAIYLKALYGGAVAKDNIAVYGFSNAMHPYSEDSDTLQNIRFEGNVAAMCDVLSGSGVTAAEFLLGGDNMTNFVAFRNYGYRTALGDVFRFGYPGTENANGYAISNYMVGRATVNQWTNLTGTANVFSSPTAAFFYVPSTHVGACSWDGNTYHLPATPFNLNGAGKTFLQWKAATGFDSSSTVDSLAPSVTVSFVRTNLYESGRANIVIYNHAGSDNVSVDVSSAMLPGAFYVIHHAADFYGPIVKSGIYTGVPIQVPMTNLPIATPIGTIAGAPTWPAFAAFVLQSTNSRPVAVTAARVRVGKVTVGAH